MSAHTPGPWVVHPTSIHPAVRSIGTAEVGPRRICTVGSTNGNPIDWHNARLIADAPRMHDLLAACEPYLKDGETPAQRIQRERLDNFAALELLAREKRKTEALLHAAKVCLMAERERRAALLPGAPATTYCEKRIALIEAAIKEAEGTK